MLSETSERLYYIQHFTFNKIIHTFRKNSKKQDSQEKKQFFKPISGTRYDFASEDMQNIQDQQQKKQLR